MEIRVETVYLQEINGMFWVFHALHCASPLLIFGIAEAWHPSLKRGFRLHRCISQVALWFDCFKKPYRNQTHIAIVLMVIQQFSVMTAECYLPRLLAGIGMSQNLQATLPGVLYGVQLLGAILGLLVIDVKERRLLLCCGSGAMFFCLVLILSIGRC